MQDSTVDFKRLVHDIKAVRDGEAASEYIPTPAECQFYLLIHHADLDDDEFDLYLRIYTDHYPDDEWIDEMLMERYGHNREMLATWAKEKNDE